MNYLPMVHITDLAKMIYEVCSQSIEQKYIFAVDDSQTTQIQLLDILSQEIGTFKENKIIHTNDHY